jgi:hypothetical protein
MAEFKDKLFHISLLQIMDEAQELHFIMNPSIALEIVKFFFYVIALHKNNLTTIYGNLS